MGYNSLALRTVDGTTGAPALEIRAPSKGLVIHEIGLSLAAATASIFGLGRPAAIGVGPTSPVTFLNEKPGDPTPSALGATAWGTTAPTAPAAFFRRIGFPAVIGSQIVWQFKGHLIVPKNTSLVIWNLASNGVADVWALIGE